MEKYLRLLFAFIAIGATLYSCKQDKNISTAANSKLTGKWYVKAIVSSSSGSPASTETDSNLADIYMFNPDNTVQISYSFLNLIIDDFYTYTNTSAGQFINMGNNKNNEPNIYTINKLTTDSLVMTIQDNASANGLTAVNSFTYKLAHK
jgi:hypothetical protein